jgi:hypothetical protein
MLACVTLPLALSGDQWFALAGVLSGVIGVGGGLVFAYFNAKEERSHGERLARSGRLHEQRFAAYREIARLLERQRLYLIRVLSSTTDTTAASPRGRTRTTNAITSSPYSWGSMPLTASSASRR